MKNFNEFITEGTKYKDSSGNSFNIKGLHFIYTEQKGRFYGTSLYDSHLALVKRRKTSKLSLAETNELLKSIGIKTEVPSYYETAELDKLCKELSKKGIACDHNDYMDVS